MRDCRRFYIDGQWVDPVEPQFQDVIDPATDRPSGSIALGKAADIDRAVAAARRAFDGWSRSTREERIDLIVRIREIYQRRYQDIATAITDEMGAPVTLAQGGQAGVGLAHLSVMIDVLRDFPFEERVGAASIVLEPIGVCGLITPWNWPINQIAVKVLPALAAGCTMVLKPSENSPFSAHIWAEILDEAGVPAGVFNLVNGEGPVAGAALSVHPDVDMMSFTGSTRAGIEIARAAAGTVKRVTQELGGKSPCVVLDDGDLAAAVAATMSVVIGNSGQTCSAPTRLLVPRARLAEAEALAADRANAVIVGDTRDPATQMGPVVSMKQWTRIQSLIEQGVAQNARLVAGGTGRPDGITAGAYVRPTVFSDVSNDMAIAREEIFGPVLTILPYDSDDEAIAIANDTPYGLAAYVWSADTQRATAAARRIRAGSIQINGAPMTMAEPFGGFKQSGNGREWGAHGLREYLEVKAIVARDSA